LKNERKIKGVRLGVFWAKKKKIKEEKKMREREREREVVGYLNVLLQKDEAKKINNYNKY